VQKELFRGNYEVYETDLLVHWFGVKTLQSTVAMVLCLERWANGGRKRARKSKRRSGRRQVKTVSVSSSTTQRGDRELKHKKRSSDRVSKRRSRVSGCGSGATKTYVPSDIVRELCERWIRYRVKIVDKPESDDSSVASWVSDDNDGY
jgi:hypothetical protein